MDNMQNLEKPLAEGRTAEIFNWKPGWVLKLYFDWFSPADIQYEQKIATAVWKSGLPVPEPGEIIRTTGRIGLEYTKCPGQSMDADLAARPYLALKYARMLAELHVRLHARTLSAGLPNLKAKLRNKIENAPGLSPPKKTAVVARLESMPDGQQLCHGDFHPGNIIIGKTSPLIIDWIDAAQGSPLADVARTTILALGEEHRETNILRSGLIRFLHAIYRRRYFQLKPDGWDEYQAWLPIVAAGRLSENILELEDWLVSQVEI